VNSPDTNPAHRLLSLHSHQLTIYYGTRWFLLCARDFTLERAQQPYRRLSATLIIACEQDFELQIAGQAAIRVEACLIAPGVARERIDAIGSEIRIFDLPIETAFFAPLAPLLGTRDFCALERQQFAHLLPQLSAVGAGEARCTDLQHLIADVVQATSGEAPRPRALDARIAQAVATINRAGSSKLEDLARAAALSPSRFRQLFKAELGCGIRSYQRWAAVWRAVWLWQRGSTWTDIALECGFFDLSHLDRAFNDVFGLNPSTVVDPSKVLLRRCED